MSMYVSEDKNLGLSSSLKMGEDTQMLGMKRGIVSILGSSSAKPTNAPSLRRAFSADLLAQHGFFSPEKKISSFDDLSDSSKGEEEEAEEDAVKEPKSESGLDVWSAILNQKDREPAGENIKPYVHPMVKRSKSSLSEKSLKICTESLGSETGSDGFSSEGGEAEEDKEENSIQQHVEQQEETELLYPTIPKNGYLRYKKPPQISFPPPIGSISHPNGGASTFMRTRRDNGRLVLEAVSIPTEKNFNVQRQNSRLVLTFANSVNDGNESAEVEEQFEDSEIEDYEDESQGEEDAVEDEEGGELEEDTEEEEAGEMYNMEMVLNRERKPSNGLLNVHRLAAMVNKPINLLNKNPNRFNEKTKGEKNDSFARVVAQSLPPRPPMSSASAMGAATVTLSNTYEYRWKPKATARNSLFYPDAEDKLCVKVVHSGNHGNGGDEPGGHSFKGCKEQKRFPPFCQPQCIAIN